MPKKFPAKIFVRWEHPSRDEIFLMAGEDLAGIVDGKTVIGTYQLVETVVAEMVVKTSTPKKAR